MLIRKKCMVEGCEKMGANKGKDRAGKIVYARYCDRHRKERGGVKKAPSEPKLVKADEDQTLAALRRMGEELREEARAAVNGGAALEAGGPGEE